MTLARKQTLISTVAWLVIVVVFVVVLARTGIERFSTDEGKPARTLLAAVIFPGYFINMVGYWYARRGRRAGRIDERDAAIERRATEIAGVMMVLAVYLFSISLFQANQTAGTVPVGWLFVLGYGTVAVVSLIQPAVALFMDFSGQIDG